MLHLASGRLKVLQLEMARLGTWKLVSMKAADKSDTMRILKRCFVHSYAGRASVKGAAILNAQLRELGKLFPWIAKVSASTPL